MYNLTGKINNVDNEQYFRCTMIEKVGSAKVRLPERKRRRDGGWVGPWNRWNKIVTQMYVCTCCWNETDSGK